MNKKVRFFISSIVSALAFFSFLSLPVDSRYYGLMVGVVLVIISFWFGLGIIFDKGLDTRLMTVLLPAQFFIGFGLFAALFPLSLLSKIMFSVVFGLISYLIFLVQNVFLVAIGFKTVPLYRAAYTINLIIILFNAFFLMTSLLSFNQIYWVNTLAVFVVSVLIFFYQFWAIAIELPDDGKTKNRWAYVLVPSLLLSEMALVFSFWPVGLFRGAIYLVAMIYVISALYQADIRERLFKKTWLAYVWVGVAIVAGVLLVTRWR